MPMPRRRFTVQVKPAEPAIDLDAWARRYVRLLLELEQIAPATSYPHIG